MTEEWRPVVGYEGLYEVSDHGRVRSLDRTVVRHDGFTQSYAGRMISIHPTKANRRAVGLYKNDKHSRRQVYTLVLEAFVGPRPEGMDACHNDGDSANDHLSNLRWDTKSANSRDVVRHGRHHEANRTHCPRGHAFMEANLVESWAKRGRRRCLACERARSNREWAQQNGRPFDFVAAADRHYAAILATSGQAA